VLAIELEFVHPSHKESIMIYGWGNPIFGDDGIGIQVAKSLKQRLISDGIKVEWSSSSPFSVVEKLLDNKKVILIDAYLTEDREEGEIIDFEITKTQNGSEILTPHTASISEVIKIYQQLYPDRFPESIHVYGICIRSPELAGAFSNIIEDKIGLIVNLILDELGVSPSE
jgi:hydrogenase maturation protease